MSLGPQPGVDGVESALDQALDQALGVHGRASALAIVSPDDSAPDFPAQGVGRLLRRGLKRALDILLALAGLVTMAPLMAMLAVIVRADSAGSVLYRQVRVGRDGRHFLLVKLRTMFDNGRVTRVGRVLRPLGLDELPQLWNVLLGHMSVVGPRPERPHLVSQYESQLPGYAWRHAVRPGITGWAQIHGLRGGARSIAERLRFDLEYLRSWSLTLDLVILARTASAVWRDTRQEFGS